MQFYSGMTGFFIIEGELDEVPKVAAAEEKLLMIQEFGLDGRGEVPDVNQNAATPADIFPITERYTAINGVVNPIIRMAPGEVQHWRLANGTLGTFLTLSLEGHDLNLISIDGIRVPELRVETTWEMAPGNRSDFLI